MLYWLARCAATALYVDACCARDFDCSVTCAPRDPAARAGPHHAPPGPCPGLSALRVVALPRPMLHMRNEGMQGPTLAGGKVVPLSDSLIIVCASAPDASARLSVMHAEQQFVRSMPADRRPAQG